MKNSFLPGILSSTAAIAGFTIASSIFLPATAASLSFTASDFTNTGTSQYDALPQVRFTLTGDDPTDSQTAKTGTIRVDVEVLASSAGYIGDMEGLAFNLGGNLLSSDLLIQDLQITDKLSVDRKTGELIPITVDELASGQGVSTTAGSVSLNQVAIELNGGGQQSNFDVNLALGNNGIGRNKGDIRSVSFTLAHRTQALDLSYFADQRFGFRLQSVGVEGGSRQYSSKLQATVPPLPPVEVEPAPVEEPAPVVIAPPPSAGPVEAPKSNEPTEIPEPGTVAALALAAAGGMKWLKRKAVTEA